MHDGVVPVWSCCRLEMAEQAKHVDRASSHQGDDQQLVHRGLQESHKESPAKHGRDSGQESQSLFFGGFISRLRKPARFSIVSVVAGRSRSKNSVASARLCSGHQRLSLCRDFKTWMPAMSGLSGLLNCPISGGGDGSSAEQRNQGDRNGGDRV
jgi:hypothetical protein